MTTAKHKCCGTVFPAGSYRTYPCRHNAKVERDGKWYCGTHDPVAIKEKQDKKNAKSDAKWMAIQQLQAEAAAKRNEQERRAAYFPDLLEALKRLLNAEHDEHLTPQGVRNLAKEVIAKAEGATT